jgi:hypothetical protein
MVIFQMLLSQLRNDKVGMAELRRTLFRHGYAVFESYIVYKDSRIARMQVTPDGVWLWTHSRKKGYSLGYKVRNLSVALHKLRQSYRNFLEAAEKPGVKLPKVVIHRPVRANALAS